MIAPLLLLLWSAPARAMCAGPSECYVVELEVLSCSRVDDSNPAVFARMEADSLISPKDRMGGGLGVRVYGRFPGTFVSGRQRKRRAVPCRGAAGKTYEVVPATGTTTYVSDELDCTQYPSGARLERLEGHRCCDTFPPGDLECLFPELRTLNKPPAGPAPKKPGRPKARSRRR